MNKHLLNTEVQNFINSNLDADPTALLFKNIQFENVPFKKVIEQIASKQRCKKKLPTWYHASNILYPNKLNIEQTSSEITAQFKSKLVEGKSLIDLTGGFGVDSYYFSKRITTITHCEINDALSEIVAHNFQELKIDNVVFHLGNGLEYLEKSNQKFDWIYVDPSRRHDQKGKVFFLADCIPNVPENLDLLFKFSDNILIKASPMLDISRAVLELSNVKKIHVVAVNNEVKELLFILSKGFNNVMELIASNIRSEETQKFSFYLADEAHAEATYGDIGNYIYEPNAALLKAGAFQIISQKLKINKLHKHTHLYTSDQLLSFPGRSFKVLKTIPYSSKTLKTELSKVKCNVSTRNFPLTVQQLRKKHQFKDGGKLYVFFTTNLRDEKLVIFCEKP